MPVSDAGKAQERRTMSCGRSRALAQLQEELLQLKQQVPGLVLRKSPPAQSPYAPFPITASAEVAAPAAAERYDVSGFRLSVRLGPGVLEPQQEELQDQQQGQQQEQQHDQQQGQDQEKQQGQQLAEGAVAVEVASGELPAVLRSAMAGELRRLWAASAPGPGRLNLPALWSEASRRFMHLITLVPQVLESYQSEDAGGSTVRRWAVLSDAASVSIDASVHVPAPPPKRAQPPAAAAAAAGAAGGAAAGGARGAAGGAPAAAAAAVQTAAPKLPAQGLPRALQQELQFVERRYGLRLLAAAPPASASAAPAGTSAAAEQLAGLRLSPRAAGSTQASQAQPAGDQAAAAAASVEFEVELQPTDPAWGPATHPPSLLLRGWAQPAAFPQPGSFQLSVSPAQPQLPDLQRLVLDRLIAAEAGGAQGAGPGAGARGGGPGPRPASLSAAVRYVANHAGELWDQAEDIAAEVDRRRREQQQQQGAQQQRQQGAQQQQQAGQQPGASPRRSSRRQPAEGGAGSAGSSESGSELDDDGAFGWGGGSSASGSFGHSSSSSREGSESESGEEEEEGEEGEQAGLLGGAGGGRGGGHSERVLPLAIQLEGLELAECDCLEGLRLNLQVACSRCRAAGELSFASAAVALPSDGPGRAGGSSGAGRSAGRPGSGVLTAAAECPNCHASWSVELAPKLVHERSNVLGHVRAEGCAPLDLLPSMLAGQCGKCSSSAAFRSAAVGRWNERACSSCHTLMRFQFSTALFVPTRGPPSSRPGAQSTGGAASPPPQRGSAAASAAAAAFNQLLVPGQPLPGKGTCKHYKHSYRWLRFPCCGQRFPCDLCHEELTDGHEMKWATRMTCGLCSTEQPIAPQCKACGKKVAATAAAPSGHHTRFWEGGKGQRDPSKMTAKDPRRWKGRNKTKSAKHKRVGQKGVEKKRE